MERRTDTDAVPDLTGKAAALLEVVRQLAEELHPRKGGGVTLTLDSQLDRDLGFDSLGRMELLTRLERTFGVTLPEQLLVDAETPRALLAALPAAVAGGGAVTMTQVWEAAPEKAAAPEFAATLLDVLAMHLHSHPQRTHIILSSETGADEELSYEALQQGAEAVAAGLGRYGLQPGQAVAIMLPTGRDYFYSFFGILLAGGIPVPIYPPARLAQIEDHLCRHAGILANAMTVMLITVPEALPLARLLKIRVEGLRHLLTVRELSAVTVKFTRPAVHPDDIALLQYTSGSTGNPKGVVLTHANLLANIRAMGAAAGVASTDLFVSWLPLYHDMGLIGAWLGSLYYAYPLVILSPLAFLARPERWLWAIHRYRGTLSAAPNFAYELCLRKIAANDIEGLDLSSWRLAFNGAEPVSPETALAFEARFAGYGLRPGAMTPVYGLAESSVGLAFPPPGRGVLVDRIRRDLFEGSGLAVPAGEESRETLRFVACGRPIHGHRIRIMTVAGREAGEREEGRLEFSGPSATSGYFRNPVETARLFHGEWLDSSDFAYLAQGEIYLSGRSKDVIFRAGRNIFPYELEEAVGNIPAVRRGCVAVFGVPDPVSGTERLVVLAETRETDSRSLEELRSRVIAVTVDVLGEPPDDVVLAPPHAVLKTSSGKIRRAASRELYLHGRTGALQQAVWLQLARFALAGVRPFLRRSGRASAGLLYGAYVWALFSLLAPLAWLAAVSMPRPVWSWRVSRIGARLLAFCSATELLVQGSENLPAGPCVLAVNHASYLDGMVLVAALARNYSFVAKRELLDSLVPRLYLQRLGADFVERFDLLRGVEDADRLTQAARSGRSLVFFPEGTFKRMPGLLPFRLGAFVVAVQGGLPVVPLVIRGTRSILPADSWLPRRGGVTVEIGRPVLPDGSDWSAAIRLRDRVRGEMLRHCGEPDLAEMHGE